MKQPRESATATVEVRNDDRVTIPEPVRDLLDLDGGEIVQLDIYVRSRSNDD